MKMNDKAKANQIINACCACATDDGIWFIHYVLPILMFYSYKDEKVIFAKTIPSGKIIYPFNIYSSLHISGNKLFMFALCAYDSFVYDISNDAFKIIDLKKNGDGLGFWGSVVWEKNIYVIPAEGKKIVKINIDNEEIEYIRIDVAIPFLNGISFDKDKIVGATTNISGIFQYDIQEGRAKIVYINDRKCAIGSVVYLDGKYYGYDIESQSVVRFSPMGIIEEQSKCFETKGAVVSHTCDGMIILDDNYSGRIFLLDKKLEVLEVIETKIPKSNLVSSYLAGCWFSKLNKTYVIAKSNEIIKLENKKIDRTVLRMDEQLWERIAKEHIDEKLYYSNNIIEEDELCNLRAFLINL